jgi:hypothetical protein
MISKRSRGEVDFNGQVTIQNVISYDVIGFQEHPRKVVCLKDIHSRWSHSEVGERDILEFKKGEIYNIKLLPCKSPSLNIEDYYAISPEGYVKAVTPDRFVDYDIMIVDEKINKLFK